jgi:hypothetical protein
VVFKNAAVCLGVFVFMTVPAWGGTYYVGFEDTVNGDYDYNDLVFELTGVTINQTGGAFFLPQPSLLDDNGEPFWDHMSQDPDHVHDNIGYCVYGYAADPGSCGGHPAGLDPDALYLAAASGGSVNNVYFTPDGQPTATVLLTITADTDDLYWYAINDPTMLHAINTNGQTTGTLAIDTGGVAFGLAANNDAGLGGTTFYSQTVLGNGGDSISHFAFFDDPSSPVSIPEPSSLLLLTPALACFYCYKRRRLA